MFPAPLPSSLPYHPAGVHPQDDQDPLGPFAHVHHHPQVPNSCPLPQGHSCLSPYAHTPTADSEFSCAQPDTPVFNTPLILSDTWQYQYPGPFNYFNTGSFHYPYDACADPHLRYSFAEGRYPSDQCEPVVLHPDFSDNHVIRQQFLYAPPNNTPIDANGALAGFETHQQYHWAKQTGSEHDLAAWAGQNHAAYVEPVQPRWPPSRQGEYTHPAQVPSGSYPFEGDLPVQPITVPSQHPVVNPSANQKYYTLSPIDAGVSYYRPSAYQRSSNVEREISQPVKQEPDGPCMDHLPFPDGDDVLQPSLSRTESQSSVSSTLSSVPSSSDVPNHRTLTTYAGEGEASAASNLPTRPTSDVRRPPTCAEEPPSSPHHQCSTKTLPYPSSRRPKRSPDAHELRPLTRRQRSSSPRVTTRPSSGPSTRSSQVSAKRHLERKPPLACLFCRARKIACGPPPPGSKDHTCNQCARRSLKCEYPTESRRGMRKRRATILVTTVPADASASDSQTPHKA